MPPAPSAGDLPPMGPRPSSRPALPPAADGRHQAAGRSEPKPVAGPPPVIKTGLPPEA